MLTGVCSKRRGDLDCRSGGAESTAEGTLALLRGSSGGRAADSVAGAADGLDELAVSRSSAAIEFAADIVDIDVDDVGAGIGLELPDVGEQFGAGDVLAAAEHEVLEEGEFFGGEAYFAAAARDLMVDAVEFEVATAKDLVGELGTTAQEGAATGGELEETERLQQAVIGAHVQALDAGVEIAVAGEDEQGGVGALRLEVREDFDAVTAGEGEVKDDKVGLIFGGEPERRVSVVEPLGGVAFGFKSLF
jgi:hypothetical protein